MTYAEKLGQFVVFASFDRLSKPACLQLKIRVLDALGCAIGALGGPPVALDTALAKFEQLSGPYTPTPLRREMAEAVSHLEKIEIFELMDLLARVQTPAAQCRRFVAQSSEATRSRPSSRDGHMN